MSNQPKNLVSKCPLFRDSTVDNDVLFFYQSTVNIRNSESFISNGQPGILSSLAIYSGNDYQRAELVCC